MPLSREALVALGAVAALSILGFGLNAVDQAYGVRPQPLPREPFDARAEGALTTWGAQGAPVPATGTCGPPLCRRASTEVRLAVHGLPLLGPELAYELRGSLGGKNVTFGNLNQGKPATLQTSRAEDLREMASLQLRLVPADNASASGLPLHEWKLSQPTADTPPPVDLAAALAPIEGLGNLSFRAGAAFDLITYYITREMFATRPGLTYCASVEKREPPGTYQHLGCWVDFVPEPGVQDEVAYLEVTGDAPHDHVGLLVTVENGATPHETHLARSAPTGLAVYRVRWA